MSTGVRPSTGEWIACFSVPTPVKKTGFSSPSRYQLSIVPQLECDFQSLCPGHAGILIGLILCTSCTCSSNSWCSCHCVIIYPSLFFSSEHLPCCVLMVPPSVLSPHHCSITAPEDVTKTAVLLTQLSFLSLKLTGVSNNSFWDIADASSLPKTSLSHGFQDTSPSRFSF